MKKTLLIAPLVLFLLTGCGKKEVVCSGEITDSGVTYSVNVVGELDGEKIKDAKVVMGFNDEESAKTMCSIMELANSFSEDEKVDFKCNGKEITVNSLADFVDADHENIVGVTADEFISIITEGMPQLTCKK